MLVINPFVCYSQDEKEISLTYQSTMLGIGKTRIYDTYLSPLKYEGDNVGLIYERIKMTGLGKNHISAQHLLYMEVSDTKNPTETANNYTGSLEYAYGLHYRFKFKPRLQVFAGLQADGFIGMTYNSRNGNNPITAKVNLNMNLSGMAVYRFQIKQQAMLLRYQLNVPFAGVLFSPEFGQSYYEISEGFHKNLMHFASFHNQWVVRNLLSVELPFQWCTLKLAYMNWVYETRVNNLNTHIFSNSVYIGFSRNFFVVPGKQSKNNYRYVFE
ncbi:MAG: DUF3316 domain-containing protein [Candidatus Azobacteroides sp.]|nr:DUF3316 domain-containing protein [Candidatus Azobacteroides sp.]